MALGGFCLIEMKDRVAEVAEQDLTERMILTLILQLLPIQTKQQFV